MSGESTPAARAAELKRMGFEEVVTHDSGAADRLRQMALRRIGERDDAVRHFEGNRMVHASDGVLAVRILVAADEEVIITAYNGPARWLKVVDGRIWYSQADDSFPYHWADMVRMADTMSIAPCAERPYGVLSADGSTVVGIFFTVDGVRLQGSDLFFTPNFFALNGQPVPMAFDPAHLPDTWDDFWAGVAAETIVPFGRRIKDQPGEVMIHWDGHRASITFEQTDGRMPQLGHRYTQSRSVGPGARRLVPPGSSTLKDWFTE